MIFSCQINKRGRLAPAAGLRSSTSGDATAALGRPGWKPPARPGLRGAARLGPQGGGRQRPPPSPGTSDPATPPGPAPQGQFISAPASPGGNGAGNTPIPFPSPPEKRAPRALLNLRGSVGVRGAPCPCPAHRRREAGEEAEPIAMGRRGSQSRPQRSEGHTAPL